MLNLTQLIVPAIELKAFDTYQHTELEETIEFGERMTVHLQ